MKPKPKLYSIHQISNCMEYANQKEEKGMYISHTPLDHILQTSKTTQNTYHQ